MADVILEISSSELNFVNSLNWSANFAHLIMSLNL